MSLEPTRENARRAAEQAAEWLVRLSSGEMSARDREAYVEWLRESPVHIAEMLRVGRVHQHLRTFRGWSALPPYNSHQEDPVIQLRGTSVAAAPALARQSRWLRPGLAAAVLGLLAILATPYVQQLEFPSIRTPAGERRELVLADESIVEVAPNSTLRVELGAHERHVVLSRGRAYFHVHKDASRPFIVEAAGAQIKAVGTAFDVSSRGEQVIVTVTEGQVGISDEHWPPDPATGARTVMVGANQQLVLQEGAPPGAPRALNAETAVQWTRGQLEFQAETIAEVVGQFNAYNRVQIRIADHALAAQRVTGLFRIADPESFVNFLEFTVPGVVSHRDADVISLDRPVAH